MVLLLLLPLVGVRACGLGKKSKGALLVVVVVALADLRGGGADGCSVIGVIVVLCFFLLCVVGRCCGRNWTGTSILCVCVYV